MVLRKPLPDDPGKWPPCGGLFKGPTQHSAFLPNMQRAGISPAKLKVVPVGASQLRDAVRRYNRRSKRTPRNRRDSNGRPGRAFRHRDAAPLESGTWLSHPRSTASGTNERTPSHSTPRRRTSRLRSLHARRCRQGNKNSPVRCRGRSKTKKTWSADNRNDRSNAPDAQSQLQGAHRPASKRFLGSDRILQDTNGAAHEERSTTQPLPQTELAAMTQYEFPENGTTCKIDDKGERTILANFQATIDKETRYRDEGDTNTILTISGHHGQEKLPTVDVNADKFPSLAWVVPAWGVRCVILPGSSIKDDLRAAIQLNSKPSRHIIYTHTGWSTANGKPAYLFNNGAITPAGVTNEMAVELPHELRHYKLAINGDTKSRVQKLLDLLKIATPQIMWPVLASIIAPLHGPVDFAVHITGRTGTFKSEIASLAQSAFGPEMDSRHLPGSWSSTANALEAQAYRAKNALFCIDDFIPTGTSWQVRAYQKTADQVIRGQGNQSGRARLNDVSSLQTTMYPRGMILSTGEDTPEGHSIRARMSIVEISPGDTDTGALTAAQSAREAYHEAIGAYTKDLSTRLKEVRSQIESTTREFRDKHVDVGHSRTPAALGRMIASLDDFLNWCLKTKAINSKQLNAMRKDAYTALLANANAQSQYLQAADPCEAFCESVRHLLGAHIGHVRSRDGGIPASPEQLGWTKEQSIGDLPTYKSHGKCIGWCSWKDDELFIDITAAYNDIRKHANNQITFTKPTMLKRLKDAGLLTRTDDSRQRNSIRITAEGHPRNVIAMPLSQTLNTMEKPQDG